MACETAGVGVYSSPRRDHDLDAVGGQHLECAGERRRRQRVSVEADEQRSVDVLLPAVLADRLADREHVGFVEADVERRCRDDRRCRRRRAARRSPDPAARCSTR